MLIIALVLAVVGLGALVTAVVTSNELIAWVCIGASVIGVILLIVDALRERSRNTAGEGDTAAVGTEAESNQADDAPAEAVDYPDEDESEQAERDTTTETGEIENRSDEVPHEASDEDGGPDSDEVADKAAGEQKT